MGTSSTTPPSGSTADPVPSLYLSDTFYSWFNTTNDLINKVNPIELYTVDASTGGHEVTFQKGGTGGFEGISLDDLGNGNWKIGYILPEKITGGHTWYGHNDFKSGPSGHIANSFCGRTGEIIGANTVSGRYAVVSGKTGNITGCVIEINGLLASEGGTIEITAGDISGSLAFATGGLGYVLAATQGGTGAINTPTALFQSSGVPDATQDALSIYGSYAGTAGSQPRVVIGNANAFKDNAMLYIEGSKGTGTAGGIRTLTNSNWGWDLIAEGSLGIAAGKNVFVDVGNDAGGGTFTVQKATVSGATAGGAGANATELFVVTSEGSYGVADGSNGVDFGTSGKVLISQGVGTRTKWGQVQASGLDVVGDGNLDDHLASNADGTFSWKTVVAAGGPLDSAASWFHVAGPMSQPWARNTWITNLSTGDVVITGISWRDNGVDFVRQGAGYPAYPVCQINSKSSDANYIVPGGWQVGGSDTTWFRNYLTILWNAADLESGLVSNGGFDY